MNSFQPFGPQPSGADNKKAPAAEAGEPSRFVMLNIAQNGSAAKFERVSRTDYRLKAGYDYLHERIMEAASEQDGLASFTMTITPEIAATILERHNLDNRPVREGRVEEFDKIISGGRWRVTSQGISFATDGRLNNGQHRLRAIVKGGHTVSMYVTLGEDREVFDVLDTGAVRGGSDVMSIAGYKNASLMAASARLLVLVERNIIFNAPKTHNDELLLIAEAHPGLSDAASSGHTVGSKFRCSTTALTVAFYQIHAKSAHRADLPAFIDRMKSGAGLPERHPILILRDGLATKSIDKHFRASALRTMAQYAGVIKAWNLTCRGRNGSIRWEHPQPLPTVI